MTVGVVTDASSLLSSHAAAALGVVVVPIPVALDGEPFAVVNGSADVFYERLRGGAIATTSQPAPDAFLDAYERAARGGARSVLSLHLDRRVSGASSSAELAARAASVPVTVVDLPTVSFGVAVCVRIASKALATGATVVEAAAAAQLAAATLDNVFVARAAPRGRISTEPDRWTLVRLADGRAEYPSSHDALDEAAEALTEFLRRRVAGHAVAVGHASSGVEAPADRLAHDLAGVASTIERYRVGPSVGAHTGPDAFGAFWWQA